MALRVAPVDHADKPAIDRHLLEVDKGHVELLAQRLPHGVVRDVVELDQHRTERKLQTPLLGQGMLELLLGDRLVGEKNLSQPATLGGSPERGFRRPLGAPRGPRPYVCEGHAESENVTGCPGGSSGPSAVERIAPEPRIPMIDSLRWCIPRSSR